VLQDWLGDTPLADFVDRHLGREPLARASTAAGATPCLGWRTLDRVLRRPGLDVLMIRSGREREVPPPRCLVELRRVLDAGVGLVVRRAEHHDAGLAALGERLAGDLPGRVHIQLFVTAAGTSGFGWHYDAEEVFIVQTRGEKDYYFRRNTIDPEPALGAQPAFRRVAEETTPAMTCTLLPGDWLYLPRGWWHVAKARTDSLSISLGVVPGSRALKAARMAR
jgi:50S ribosomal protein L16 3-hydroxylase